MFVKCVLNHREPELISASVKAKSRCANELHQFSGIGLSDVYTTHSFSFIFRPSIFLILSFHLYFTILPKRMRKLPSESGNLHFSPQCWWNKIELHLDACVHRFAIVWIASLCGKPNVIFPNVKYLMRRRTDCTNEHLIWEFDGGGGGVLYVLVWKKIDSN